MPKKVPPDLAAGDSAAVRRNSAAVRLKSSAFFAQHSENSFTKSKSKHMTLK